MTYSRAAAETGTSVAAVEAANPWPARDIPVGVTIRVPGSGGYVPRHTAPAGEGGAYGHPYTCGDGDGDGWDLPCSALHSHSAGPEGSSYVPRHAAPVQQAAAPVQQAAAPVQQAAAPGGGAGSGSFQQCVISRESGGNYSAVNSASGAGGAYQFLPSTWHGLGYSGSPQNASRSQQDAAFHKLYAELGSSPWGPSDGCH